MVKYIRQSNHNSLEHHRTSVVGGLTMIKVKKDFLKFEISNYPDMKQQVISCEPPTTTAVLDFKMKIVGAIEKAMTTIKQNSINGIHKERVIRDYFWSTRRLSIEGVAMEHHVHRNTAQNWIDEFIIRVGENLGILGDNI